MTPYLPNPDANPPGPSERNVFQVEELVTTLKHALEMTFPALWVEGEISNFVAARSGHWYFSLKDDKAQIRCAFFRGQNLRKAKPDNGQRCLVHGRATLFAARGELQLVVDDIEDAGTGALHLAFERLKRSLNAEGLFAQERKHPLPASPRRIGILTSTVGAALHDVLTTLRRRNPLAEVIVYPIPVQGQDAAVEIVRMLHCALRRAECDVLLLTRGGGSLEDLQAFNDETLARAIAAAQLPIVSAIGHEVDFSISDFVADARAATPTAAAELLSPDQRQWRRNLQLGRAALDNAMRRRLRQQRELQQTWLHRLQAQSPQRKLLDRAQWLDHLQVRLRNRLQQLLQSQTRNLRSQQSRIHSARMEQRLRSTRQQLEGLRDRHRRALSSQFRQQQVNLQHLQQRLQDMHPDHVLHRGYSIVWDGEHIVRESNLPPGRQLRIQLADGDLKVSVSQKN